MMNGLNNTLFRVRYAYSNPLDQQRAQILTYLLLIASSLASITAVVTIIDIAQGSPATLSDISSIAGPVIGFALYGLVQIGQLNVAIYCLIFVALLSGSTTITNGVDNPSVVAMLLPTVIAGVLLTWRAVLLSWALVTGLLVASAAVNSTIAASAATLSTVTSIHAIMGILLVLFSGNLRQATDRFVREVQNLRRIAGLSGSMSANAREQDFIREAINVLRDNLGYSFAQVFLVNDDGEVTQRVATALNTAQVNTYSDVDLSPRSAIYEAVRAGEAVTVSADASELRRDHLLPGVAAGLALPIYAGDTLIGVLDVQRERDDVFSEQERGDIKLVAQNLGTAISRARELRQMSSDITQQQKLLERLRERLRDYERAESSRTVGAWSSYLEQRGVEMLGYDLDGGTPQTADGIPNELRPALNAGDITITEEGDSQIVRVPIQLRDQTLGAMAFRVPKSNQAIGQRQEELMRSVTQRLSLALENQRLFEQSQSQARRESRANEIGNRLLTSTDIETVLRLAADDFNEALGAVQTRITLEPEADSSGELTPEEGA